MLTDKLKEDIKKYLTLIFLNSLAAISLGLFLWELNHWPQLKEFVLNNTLSKQEQDQILKGILISFFFTITPASMAIAIKFPSNTIKVALKNFLKLICILFLVPFLLNKELWVALPFIMITLSFLSAFYVFHIMKHAEFPTIFVLKTDHIAFKIITYAILSLLILGYGFYFSYYTILNHYHFYNQTFDFGFYQSAFVNTLHGHFMSIPYYNGQSVFRAHCDFIWLLYLPFFYLFPKAETLLILQSFSIALAALPLFLLSYKILKSRTSSLIIAILFLLHPANHTANFYDIHQLCLLPLCVFSFFYFLEIKNSYAFLISIFLLLIIKVDMFLLLLSISFFIYFNNKNDLRFATFAFGISILYTIVYILFLNKWLKVSYYFYYEDIMLDKTGGMGEVIKTILTNPVFILKTLFKEDKLIYFCQLFGPLLFVPLLRRRNYLLFIYGLAITLLATRPGLYDFHFQYVWYIVPFIFIGLIYFLKDIKTNDNRAISKNKMINHVLFASFKAEQEKK